MLSRNRRLRLPLLLSLLLPLLLSGLFSCGKELPDMTNPPEPAPFPSIPVGHLIDPDSEVRGVWIASVWNLDYPSRTDLSAAELEAEADAILNDCAACGINTLFFQVRPAADALYDSDLFPVSSALSSTGELVFDPLRYFVNEARPRNIRVYAWVNPLRATLTAADPASLPEKHPARLHPEWTVSYGDGRLYLDPGLPEVRQFVADGVREIVTKYDVDGVVFDDYFYPYPSYDANGAALDFPDDASWEKYGGGSGDRADWRRQNINEIVKMCYETVHFIDPECVFGVSPYGVWQNRNGDNGGSETNSFEAYKSLYCDAPAWIDGGYLDFLSPQIYWDFDSSQAPFDTLIRWWNDRLDGTNVKLYVSHAAYKYDEADWPDPAGELVEQITYARSERSYYGSILYGYDELRRNAKGAADDVKAAFEPEIIYYDDTVVPFYPTFNDGVELTAYYYNTMFGKNHGRQEVVACGKVLNEDQRKAMVWDVERGVPCGMVEPYWQTDTCIGSWHYDRGLYDRNGYKSAETVIRMLVDIVSKGGNLLLSVPIRADGTVDEKERAVCAGIGDWMKVNGEGIYGTRTWKRFGSGPQANGPGERLNAQGFNEGRGKPATAEDLRYTTKDGNLYVFTLAVPESGAKVTVPDLDAKVKKVSLLGSAKDVKWTQEGATLTIDAPEADPNLKIALCFKVEFDK